MAAESADGAVLYTSEDGAASWQRRSVISQLSEFPENPSYPTITFRPDGSLLCQCHLGHLMENYYRVSHDNGYTWSSMKPASIRLRHPVLAYVGENIVAVGRAMPVWRPGFYVSGDDGESWKGPYDLTPDLPHGAGGYTAVIPLKDEAFIVTSSYAYMEGSVASLSIGSAGEPNTILGLMIREISM